MQTKNFPQAYEYQKLFSAYNDSVINEETNTTIAELQTKYKVEKKTFKYFYLIKKIIKRTKASRNKEKHAFLHWDCNITACCAHL